jgi:hypothetical protein
MSKSVAEVRLLAVHRALDDLYGDVADGTLGIPSDRDLFVQHRVSDALDAIGAALVVLRETAHANAHDAAQTHE